MIHLQINKKLSIMTTQNNSLTDKEYYQLTISIAKALNSYEMPIKSKHIR